MAYERTKSTGKSPVFTAWGVGAAFFLWHKLSMDPKPIYRRTGLILVETLAVIFVCLVIAASALSWRLLYAPLDLEFARSYIQEALHDEETGRHAQMDKVVLYWPDLRGPLLLGLQGAAVYGADGEKIVSVDEAALGINKAQLFFGRVRPEGLILKRPSLSVIRKSDNSFDIGVADFQTYGPKRFENSDEAQGDFIERILEYVAGDEAGHDERILSRLRSFEIEEASILVDDRVLKKSWILPHTDALLERTLEGLKAGMDVRLPSEQEGAAPRAHLDALINLQTKTVDLEVTLERFNVAFLADKLPELDALKGQDVVLDARLQAQVSEDLSVRHATLTALSDAGALNIAQWSAGPVAYKDLGLLAKYDAAQGTLDVSKLKGTFGGISLEGEAGLKIEGNKISGPAQLKIAALDHSAIAPLWPVALAEDNAKEWIVDKLGQGRFSDLYAQGDLEAVKTDAGWEPDVKNLEAGFAFEGMAIDYRAPLKPVTDAKGRGTFDLSKDEIRIDIEAAKVLDLDIPEASVVLSQVVAEGKGDAAIDLKLKGPLKSVLTYVRDEPIGAQTEIDVANAQGQADMAVQIALPMREEVKVEDVKVTVKGTVSDALLPKLVRGLGVSGGPFNVSIADNLLRVNGQGKLEGRPIKADYSTFLISAGAPYTMKVAASLTADAALRDRFGVDLSSFMDGLAGLDLVYTEFADGGAQADVKADLTPSRVFVEPFDYVKNPGAPAQAAAKAVLHNGELKEVRDLTGSAPALTLENTVLGFRQRGAETQLASGKVSRFTLNETVAKLEFEVERDSGRTKIAMDGPFLDLRPFLNNEGDKDKPYTAPPLEISVAVDRMRTADEETVGYGKLYADIDGAGTFNQMEMDAIAGSGDIYLRYKPDGSGKRVFRLEADDAGATLKAFDLYDNVRGGKLVIYGEPIRGVYDRNLIGVAEMTDFKVVKAPALARLLSAMSLAGLTQSLSGEGLSFAKMEANFDWLYRPGGSLLVLKDGRTSGNSLGLTFDGTFDNAAQTLDVNGTIIPLSGVNKMIGDIPLIGDILTGGTGALIAATYTMKGSSAEPEVAVNPLSVLTPGILRRILFEQN